MEDLWSIGNLHGSVEKENGMSPAEIRNLAYRYANEFDQHCYEVSKILVYEDCVVLVNLFVEALHELDREKETTN